MRAMRKLVALSLIALGACADDITPVAQSPAPAPVPSPVATAAPAAAPAAAPVTLTADTPETTAAGAAFTAPAGWTFVVDGPTAKLTGPEPDLHLTIVDSSEKGADDAVAAAWRLVHPGFKWALKVTTPRPGRHGWEERRDYDYETSPDEKLVVFALAVRKGASWTVGLFEGGNASFEKRVAGVEKVAESMRPAGYTRESFAGRTPLRKVATPEEVAQAVMGFINSDAVTGQHLVVDGGVSIGY